MNILITGAGGFIGKQLASTLVQQEHTIRGLFLPEEDASQCRDMGVEIIRGNVCDPASLTEIANNIDIVFHLAARVSDWGAYKDFHEVTIEGTRHLLNACRHKNIKRFVYISSFTALGVTRQTKGMTEAEPCIKTGIPYSDTKMLTEQLVKQLSSSYQIPYTIIRPANVIGYGSNWISEILNASLRAPLPVIGDGNASCAFVNVQNLIDGMILAATSPDGSEQTYQFRDDFELSWGEYIELVCGWVGKKPSGRLPILLGLSIGALCETFCNLLNTRPPVTRLGISLLGLNHDVSNTKAKKELGWQPRKTLDDTMMDVKQWVLNDYRAENSKKWESFHNIRVYITGGSQGIGFELAKKFAQEGAHIALFARSKKQLLKAQEVVESHARHPSQRIVSTPLDVTNINDVTTAFYEVKELIGAIDILINSAGIIANDAIEKIPQESFESVFKTNVFGPRNTITAALNDLKESNGHIINIASAAGLMGLPGYTAYGGSKYALVGLSECLRSELKPHGVTVSCVCPPEVKTEMLEAEAKTISQESKLIKKLAGTLSPEYASEYIIKKIRKKKFMIIPGKLSKISYTLHSFSLGHSSRVTSDVIARWMRGKRSNN